MGEKKTPCSQSLKTAHTNFINFGTRVPSNKFSKLKRIIWTVIEISEQRDFWNYYSRVGPQWVAVDELWGYVGSTKTTLIPHSAQGGVPTQPLQQFCPFGSHTSRKQQNMGLLTENSCGAHVGPYGVHRSSDPLDLQISLCPHWAAHHAGTLLIRRHICH